MGFLSFQPHRQVDPRLRRQPCRSGGGRPQREAALRRDLRHRRDLRRRIGRAAPFAGGRAPLHRRRLYASGLHHCHHRWSRQHAGRPPWRPPGRRVGGGLGLRHHAFAQEHVQLRPVDHRAPGAAAGPSGAARMNLLISSTKPRRTALALALFVAVMLVLPLFAGNYVVSMLVVVLFSAYVGQAWNLMMGYAGQLSLGHALYVGLGAYISGALFVHYGLPPWIGMLAGMAAAGLAGVVIATLSFRFGVTGVYFALLTIAFAQFTRIAFNHFEWVGGSSGLYLPVVTLTRDDIVHLRGSPTMFYYVLLSLTLAALALSHLLLGQRIGFYWRGIRGNQDVAQAAGIDVFRYQGDAGVL